MLLSVIIPVYNVEAYVGKTLESVFHTTASSDDFEVIVVNDGTKDGSMKVVRQFADRPNLTILDIHSDNGVREVWLTPGDIAQYDRQAGDVTLGKISSESFHVFSENRSFSFFNVPLCDIAADLERSFGTEIVIADPSIVSRRFLAFFTNHESLDDILRLLSANGNLRIVQSGGVVYMYGK